MPSLDLELVNRQLRTNMAVPMAAQEHRVIGTLVTVVPSLTTKATQ